ncbi:MAG: hypothetical protein ACFWUD_00235 [Thermocaproicibacter melissae]|jgi:hypothetical protein
MQQFYPLTNCCIFLCYIPEISRVVIAFMRIKKWTSLIKCNPLWSQYYPF